MSFALESTSPYKAYVTREPFLFYEMRTAARLLSEGASDEEAAAKITTENLFQYPTEKSIGRMARACIVQKIIADKTGENNQDRTFRCSFNLKQLKYSNTATYYLVIMDEEGLMMPQREEFLIDTAFAVDEFDFF